MNATQSAPLHVLLGLEDEHTGLRVETVFPDRTVSGRWVLPTEAGILEVASAADRIGKNVPGATTRLVDESGRVVPTPEVLSSHSRLVINGIERSPWLESTSHNLMELDRSLQGASNWRDAQLEHRVKLQIGEQIISLSQTEKQIPPRPAVVAGNLLRTLSRPQSPTGRRAGAGARPF